MAKLEELIWAADFAGPTRRDRRPCRYSVYLPDQLTGRRFALDGDVAADVADAEAALVKLNAAIDAPADTEALAQLLLRAESVASSLSRVWWWVANDYCEPTQLARWARKYGTSPPPRSWPTSTPWSGEWQQWTRADGSPWKPCRRFTVG